MPTTTRTPADTTLDEAIASLQTELNRLDRVTADELAVHPLLTRLGPEPLGPDFTAAHLFARTRRRRTATKTLLMDAHEAVQAEAAAKVEAEMLEISPSAR